MAAAESRWRISVNDEGLDAAYSEAVLAHLWDVVNGRRFLDFRDEDGDELSTSFAHLFTKEYNGETALKWKEWLHPRRADWHGVLL